MLSGNSVRELAGGGNNNMPPSAYKTGGFDWLELSVYVDLTTEFDEYLKNVFETALQEAENLGEEQAVHIFPDGRDRKLCIQPWGATVGNFRYRYRAIDEKGIVWLFREDPKDHDTIPAVRIRMTGETLLCSYESFESLVEWVKGFFKDCIYKTEVRKMAVGRVDMCVDLPDVSVLQFKNAHFKRHFCAVARSESVTCSAPSDVDGDVWRYIQSKGLTLYYGQSPLTLRIYDKLAELDHKLNPRKLQAMIDLRWGGQMPEKATRCEFELRREALKQRGIDTVDDLIEKKAALADYLCCEWFRYVQRKRGSSDSLKRRWPVLPAWENVQESFATVFWGDSFADLSAIKPQTPDCEALFKQIMGVALKAADVQGQSFSTYGEFMNYVAKNLQPIAKKKHESWFETHRF